MSIDIRVKEKPEKPKESKPQSLKVRRDSGDSYWVYMVIVIGIVLSIPLVKSYFEMKTFNKFTTGPKANYIDALCSELRVEANRVSQ